MHILDLVFRFGAFDKFGSLINFIDQERSTLDLESLVTTKMISHYYSSNLLYMNIQYIFG